MKEKRKVRRWRNENGQKRRGKRRGREGLKIEEARYHGKERGRERWGETQENGLNLCMN